MGALSFAADTLASFSSGFSHKNVALARINLANLNLDLDSDAHRILREFSTGMKMLYKYGSHNPCNISSITRQNLKLLHTNLKANPSFRKSITAIKFNASDSQPATWMPLVNDENIGASILYLPAEAGISLNSANSTSTPDLSQDISSAPSVQDRLSYNVKQLYLALLGNVQIEMTQQNKATGKLLKMGESFTGSFSQINNTRITAIKNASLILNIQLPAI